MEERGKVRHDSLYFKALIFILRLLILHGVVPGGGAGVAAAAVGRGDGSGGSPVGSVELCVVVSCGAPGRFEHWERSDVGAAT